MHAIALVALLGATRYRETIVAAVPLQVALLAEAKPRTPDAAPRLPDIRLQPFTRELLPMPEIAIAAPASADAVPATRTEPVAAVSAPRAESAPAAPLVPPAFDADYLSNPAPAYPPISRRLNEEGKAIVRVFVTPDGRAERVELVRSSGHERLDRSALEAVARWRFVPARQGAVAVAAHVLVPVQFVLKS